MSVRSCNERFIPYDTNGGQREKNKGRVPYGDSNTRRSRSRVGIERFLIDYCKTKTKLIYNGQSGEKKELLRANENSK